MARVTEISTLCHHVTKFIETSKAYTYQLGTKVVDVPIVAERETSQQTGDLCLKVVVGLGFEDVTFSDIDTAHRSAIPRCFQHTKRHYL